MAQQLQDYLTANGDTLKAYSVAMVSDPSPSTDALHWIGLTAGKQYPYAFITTGAGEQLWAGPLPTAAADAITTINQLTNRKTQNGSCPNGNCRPRRWQTQ